MTVILFLCVAYPRCKKSSRAVVSWKGVFGVGNGEQILRNPHVSSHPSPIPRGHRTKQTGAWLPSPWPFPCPPGGAGCVWDVSPCPCHQESSAQTHIHPSQPQARLPLAFLGGKEERPGLCPAPSQSSAPSLPGHSMGSGCHQPNLSCACPHPSNLQGMGGPKSHLSSLTHGSGGYLRPSSAAQGITARGGSSLLPPPRLATASGDPAPACAGTAPGGSRPPAACKLRQGSVGFQRGRHAPHRGSPNTHSWARRGLPSREWPQSLPLPPLVPASPAFPPPVQSSRTGQCPRGWDNSAPAPKSQE